ncbi:MAG: polysaccharide biosynthesis tyrosine autokinase [Desulfobulbaceae bacterium]|jgi:succinoglycan biosynthesis transport protein ExoP|nr:polysaccharide biosynthesis tyrosine autokinase [Desulfobulbaceae bacterium]
MNTNLPQEQVIHLRDYYRVIKKHKAIVLTFAFITIALGLLLTLAQTPKYAANVNILIERNYDTDVTGEGYIPRDPHFYGTQFAIIQSRNVVRRMVEELKLDTRYRHYFFKPESTSLLQPIKDWLKDFITLLIPQEDPDEVKASATDTIELSAITDAQIIIDMILGDLTAKPIPNTKIVVIEYTHEHPAMAQLIVNNIAKAYMDEILEIKMHASSYAIEWMTSKAKEEKKKLAASENLLQQYSRDHDLVTVENKMAIVPQKLSEFSRQLSTAEADMQQLNEVYLQIKNAGDDLEAIESIPAVTANKTLQALRDAILKAEQHIGELSEKYGYKHPMMIKAVSERDGLLVEKRNEIKRIERSTKNDYKLARSKAINLQGLLDQTKQELLNIKERFIQYDILKREVDTNRILYDALIGRIKQQSASEQTQAVNIWVVKNADLPKSPSSQRKKYMLLALSLGIFGGVGIAFLIEYLDNTIKSASDLARRIGFPILGIVASPKKDQDINTIVKEDSKSLISESYRSIRSQVLLSSAEHPPKTILVCSVSPKEGKTTTAANFARTLAQTGKSVLIIDCDLRKPRLHTLFKIPNQVGLSTFLTGSDTEVSILPLADEPMHIIPSGPIPPNPSELLTSNQMHKLLAAMKARYDFVIIDSPPVLSVTDSQILSKMADGTLLIVRYGQTTWEQLQHGTKLFTDVQATMLGVVLNGVEEKGGDTGYYYQGYYAYYGDDAKRKS